MNIRNKLTKQNMWWSTRVLLALLLAFGFSSLMVNQVFVANSPRIRHDLAGHLKSQVLTYLKPSTYLALLKGNSAEFPNVKREELQEVANKPYGPTFITGVYAKETNNVSIVEIKHSQIQWVAVPYTKKDGTQIYLNIPAGTEPPEMGLF